MRDERDNQDFGEIRVGVTTTLVRSEVRKAVNATLGAILVALVGRLAGRDAAVAVDASPDSRDPERAVAPRAR